MHVENVDRVLTAKKQSLDHLLTRTNVVGVGIGYKESDGVITDEVAVTVNVAQKVPKAQLAESDKVPREINGVKTDVVETGRFLAGQMSMKAISTKDRWRPTIPPGVSMGHQDVTAGTFGCLVRRGSEIFILSNNHVLANVNLGKTGDPIIQPGRYDGGGTPIDKVATLADYIPLDFGSDIPKNSFAIRLQGALNFMFRTFRSKHRWATYESSPGENWVDAALARPLDADQFIAAIHKIGNPKGISAATLGTKLQKTGRTTGYTQGHITQIDVTTSVEYNGKMAKFTRQFMASGMSSGGDSGSAILDENEKIIGLLFAGSGNATLINPIQSVLDLLNVEIVV